MEDLIESLINAGADPNILNDAGEPAFVMQWDDDDEDDEEDEFE